MSRLILDSVALLFSLGMLAALLPPVRLPSLVQILYYLLVPGYPLLQLVDYPFGKIDKTALTVMISLGLLVGLTALFQVFYPNGAINESFVIPLVTIAALVPSLRRLTRRPKIS